MVTNLCILLIKHTRQEEAMIIAELRGKLSDDQVSSIERSEDVLTSNVFQCMRYLPPNKGILPFLNEVFRDCGIQREISLNEEWKAEYYFCG